jgi:hypothetical protein
MKSSIPTWKNVESLLAGSLLIAYGAWPGNWICLKMRHFGGSYFRYGTMRRSPWDHIESLPVPVGFVEQRQLCVHLFCPLFFKHLALVG